MSLLWAIVRKLLMHERFSDCNFHFLLKGTGLRNSIIIELGIGFNIVFSNSIGIGIEIGIAKKSRPVLLLVLVLQFTLSQYWY